MPRKRYKRIFSDARHIGYFFENALGVDPSENFCGTDYDEVVLKVAGVEKQLLDTANASTLKSPDNRLGRYSDPKERKRLRAKIYNELIHQPRLADDDDIALGKGGALPITELHHDSQAYIVIGLPAAGKSELTDRLSDELGAMIIDSDYAKRKFPEYRIAFGADLVHDESSIIMFGGQGEWAQEPNVLNYAVSNKCNIIIPKIGDDTQKIEQLAANLKLCGYAVHLVLVRLDRRLATQRACERFLRTGRYVSLPLIFDVFGNDPTITFYDLLLSSTTFESYKMYSADVPRGEPKKLMYSSTSGKHIR